MALGDSSRLGECIFDFGTLGVGVCRPDTGRATSCCLLFMEWGRPGVEEEEDGLEFILVTIPADNFHVQNRFYGE